MNDPINKMDKRLEQAFHKRGHTSGHKHKKQGEHDDSLGKCN